MRGFIMSKIIYVNYSQFCWINGDDTWFKRKFKSLTAAEQFAKRVNGEIRIDFIRTYK